MQAADVAQALETVRWLITGAQGFIGRYVSAQILASQADAVVLGTGRSARLDGCFSHCVTGPKGPVRAPLPESVRKALDSRFEYRSVPITDVERMTHHLATFQPDVILHLASALRGDSMNDLLATNVTGTESLFASIALSGCKIRKVVVASSGGVYGEVDAKCLPSREFDEPAPADDYSLSKLLAENSARRAAMADRIPLAVVRIFNVLGPGQDERHVAGKIAAQLMPIQRGWNDEISLGVLTCTRDFIDVRDVARALMIIAEKGDGTLNVGAGSELPVNALLDEFLKNSRVLARIRSEARDGGVTRNCGDVTRLQKLGFERQYSLADSVAAILSYYAQLWNSHMSFPCTPK